MSFHIPADSFLVDCLGAAKFARETMKLARKKRLDLDAAVYWAARAAAHWAQLSTAWRTSHLQMTDPLP